MLDTNTQLVAERTARTTGTVLRLIIVALLAAPPAAAHPNMIRLGYPSCAACHVSPQGGGLLTRYGRSIDLTQTLRPAQEVRPAELNNCFNCHLDAAPTAKATFELPLRAAVLGTTVSTGSSYGPPKVIDRDPANDLNITPIAAVCSACHDDSETREHMVEGGARFAVLQSAINSGQVVERCVSCHGPGQEEDVRRVHIEDDEDDEEEEDDD